MHARIYVSVPDVVVIALMHGLYDIDVCDRTLFSGEVAQALTDLHGALEMDVTMPESAFHSADEAIAHSSMMILGGVRSAPTVRVPMLHDSAIVIADWYLRGDRVNVPQQPAVALAFEEYCVQLCQALKTESLLTELAVANAIAHIGKLDCEG